VREIGADTLVLGVILLSIFLVKLLVDYLLGSDAKFFDVIPVRYVIDVGHILAFLKYTYNLFVRFGK
jgi:hypothetical protein